MSAIKEEAVQIIKELPEEQVKYAIHYLRTLRITKGQETPEMQAFSELEQMLIPAGRAIDYDRELAEAREEKYGYTS